MRGVGWLTGALRELGWAPGENYVTEMVFTEGRLQRLEELAGELVRRKVDVIWVPGGPQMAVAAARVTKSTPIVFAGVSLPVELGLVASLGRPGGNVTGVADAVGPDQFQKLFELLKVIAPATRHVAMIAPVTALYTVSGQAWLPAASVMPSIARQLDLAITRVEVRQREEFDRVFADVLAARADAIFVVGDPVTLSERKRIIDFANRNRLASTFGNKAFTIDGGLLSYATDGERVWRRSAYHVDRILRGTPPADVPVELPTTFELVINAKTARALGLTIPPSLLLRADRIVE
jgi:putative ABC transport system substrate-binding protein